MATVYAGGSGWDYLTGTKSIANASYMYSYFKNKGWSHNAICGFIGNTTWECYNNPALVEANGYGGFGIVQWTPSSEYTVWAKKRGYPCGSDLSNPEMYLLGQLERVMYEYNNGLQFFWDSVRSHVYRTRFDGTTWKNWATTSNSIAWATEAFMACYERPDYEKHHLDERITYANTADSLFSGASSTQSATYAQKACEWAIDIAEDDSHGYDQIHREGPDYDCSSLVINAYQNAGLDVKGAGASYTGDMYNAFLSVGFSDVTSQVDLKTGTGLIAGDVLLNTQHHTAMSIGDGKIVQASINERGETKYGQTGDQTGTEIYVRNYYLYSRGWDYVLRYDGYEGGFGVESAAQGVSIVRAIPITRVSWEANEERDG